MVPETHRLRSLLLATPLLAGSLLAGCGGAPAPAGDDPMPLPAELDTRSRNVVVVLSDTHRADHALPGEGAGRPAPNVGLLARDGAVFTAARTPVPISAPAYATLFTGVPPSRHGLLNNQQQLGPELPVLAERLGQAGYRTAAVVSNPFCSAGHGFGRGFDHFWDGVEEHGKEGELVTGEAIRWLESRDAGQPFFLFVAYMDAHTPYVAEGIPPSLLVAVDGEPRRILRAENAHLLQRLPLRLAPGRHRVTLTFLEETDGGELHPAEPADGWSPLHVTELGVSEPVALRAASGVREAAEDPSFRQLGNRAVLELTNPTAAPVDAELRFRCYRRYGPENVPGFYRAGVRSFDHHFGRLLAHLQERGLYDDAVVVFLSDHGEMLGEDGAWGHVPHLRDETLRIPLVVKAPGLPAGASIDRPIELGDLHHLLLALATGELPEGAADRFPFTPEPEQLLAATYPPEGGVLQVVVRRGDLELRLDGEGHATLHDVTGADPERDLLPDRRNDPGVRRMLAAAREEMRRVAELETLDPGSLTEEERGRLRALGYL